MRRRLVESCGREWNYYGAHGFVRMISIFTDDTTLGVSRLNACTNNTINYLVESAIEVGLYFADWFTTSVSGPYLTGACFVTTGLFIHIPSPKSWHRVFKPIPTFPMAILAQSFLTGKVVGCIGTNGNIYHH